MPNKQNLLVLPAVQNIEEIIKGISTPIELTKGSYKDLEFIFKNDLISLMLNGIDIKDFSNVWLSSSWGSRDLAYAVKLYLDHFNTSHTFVEKACSKITDQMIFSFNSISTPSTFFIDSPDITNYIEIIEKTCGYPLIIKDTTGSGGKNSFYVQNRAELKLTASLLEKTRKYFFQKYIPNDYDWGVLVADGRIVSAEKSYPTKKGEFRNNCNGAEEVFVSTKLVPENIREIAVSAGEALGLTWYRADIIVDKNTNIAYLMEINRFPGISSGTDEVRSARKFLKKYMQEYLIPVEEVVPALILKSSVVTYVD